LRSDRFVLASFNKTLVKQQIIPLFSDNPHIATRLLQVFRESNENRLSVVKSYGRQV